MTDFAKTYELTRKRFDDSIVGLTNEQLNFRLHGDTLTIGEMALHVAGVELWFISQLTGLELSETETRIAKCATDGAVNDLPFPFSESEITGALVDSAMAKGREVLEPIIANPSSEVLAKELKSALGPIISGEGAFVRMSAHPFYHQGQVYMIKSAPNFPN
jgi:hypothetical protein